VEIDKTSIKSRKVDGDPIICADVTMGSETFSISFPSFLRSVSKLDRLASYLLTTNEIDVVIESILVGAMKAFYKVHYESDE